MCFTVSFSRPSVREELEDNSVAFHVHSEGLLLLLPAMIVNEL